MNDAEPRAGKTAARIKAVAPVTQGRRSSPAAAARLAAWLDQRTGYSTVVKLIVDEPVPGGARWWYVFGAVLMFLLGLEFVTGALLATAYAPSATTAWASTAFIQDTLTLGWFVRGLHSFGSTAMLVLAGIHLAQVLIFGAYKAPRELTWLTGLGLLGVLLAFALSGAGLPWDEQGAWAKQVESGILGATPVIGAALQMLFEGGNAFGNYTVTHLYALHVVVLPAVVGGLVLGHVLLVRRHGVTPRWRVDEATLALSTQQYWPHQAVRDAAACGVTFIVLALAVTGAHGANLGAPVDFSGTHQARPEWYVLPLHQLRKVFAGSLEMIATLLIPGVGAVCLAALPWLDGSASRDPRRRPWVMAGALFGVVALGVLGYLPLAQDKRDRPYQAARARAAERAVLARELAKQGVPAEGGLAVFRNDPAFRARTLWDEHCEKCHGGLGDGGSDGGGAAPEGWQHRVRKGPSLAGYGTRGWIDAFLRAPDNPRFMGNAKFEKGMRPVEGTPQELRALTELVYAETGADDVDRELVAEAQPLFSEKDCDACHDRDGTSANTGPNLKGRGTLAYLVDVINDAGDHRLFGPKNKMPRFGDKLTPDEIAELARFVWARSRH